MDEEQKEEEEEEEEALPPPLPHPPPFPLLLPLLTYSSVHLNTYLPIEVMQLIHEVNAELSKLFCLAEIERDIHILHCEGGGGRTVIISRGILLHLL